MEGRVLEILETSGRSFRLSGVSKLCNVSEVYENKLELKKLANPRLTPVCNEK